MNIANRIEKTTEAFCGDKNLLLAQIYSDALLNFSRPISFSDLGLPSPLEILNGTFSLQSRVATVKIDMIQGKISNPLQLISALSATAKKYGAKTLKIKALLANDRLNEILKARYGMVTENGVDLIVIPIK